MVGIQLGYTANMLGDMREAGKQAQTVADLARGMTDRYFSVEWRILQSQCYSYGGKPAQIGPLLIPHMAYLTDEIRHETMGQTMIRAVTACAHLAVAEAFLGRTDSSSRWQREGHAVADEAQRPFDLMYMQFVSGVCLDLGGHHSAAVEAHEKSAEIAEARGIPMGVDCVSPPAHSAFSTPLEMMVNSWPGMGIKLPWKRRSWSGWRSWSSLSSTKSKDWAIPSGE